MSECSPRPFLKWAGGKRYLAPKILEVAGSISGTYFEPFVGAGAVLFSKPPATSYVIGDLNTELVVTYKAISREARSVVRELEAMEQTESNFYRVRELDRIPGFLDKFSPVEIAARMIFLNRLAFNGLFRVNSKNQFNVPFGKRTFSVEKEAKNLEIVGAFLAGRCEESSVPVKITAGTYASTCEGAGDGDLVYLDPPYAPLKQGSFVNYQSQGFSYGDQVALRDFALELRSAGAKCLISNSDVPHIRDLYSNSSQFRVHDIAVPRRVGASSDSRSSVNEVLIETVQG